MRQDFFIFERNIMTPLFKKLNYKTQPEICVLNAPPSMDEEIQAMRKVCKVIIDLKKYKSGLFVMVFVTTQQAVEKWANEINNVLAEDGVLYFCYPKGTSKKHTCDFNRDTGWHVLGDLGFEPVRQVAIDEDWSALRFRKPAHIKKMTRSFAMTAEGKKKANL